MGVCVSNHLIFIIFNSSDCNYGTPPENFTFPFNYYYLVIHATNLTKISSTHYWDGNVQDLMVKNRKKLFHFDLYPTCQ
jgi:hypothetical protein